MRLSRKNRFILTVVVFAFLTIYQRVFGLALPPKEPVVTNQHVLGEEVQVSPQVSQEVQVTRVVDGDTLEVLLNSKKEKVRIIGINTPETVDPRKPVQCFGKEASAFAKATLTDAAVSLVADPTQGDRDKYGRLLRYVFLKNSSVDFGLSMITNGYAHEYTYDIPYQYQLDYKKAENDARIAKRGLWADAACSHASS